MPSQISLRSTLLILVSCIYSMQHMEKYFPHPQKFIPERWIVGEPQYLGDSENAMMAFKPFSLGPRSCAGKAMAINQILITMASLIWAFDFRAAEDSPDLIGEADSSPGRSSQPVDEYRLKANVTAQGVGPLLVFRASAKSGYSKRSRG